MAVKPLQTGIYGIIGAPGSGKSFYAVREIARTACGHARPIYTNIPIRPKKLRAYIYRKLPYKIQGHAARRARANLVKPISQTHFERFCKRLGLIDRTAERIMNEWGLEKGAVGELAEFKQTEARNLAMSEVAKLHGDPKITGSDADWVPPGSVLFLDELHKWYPSKNYKNEPKEILDFTSMHRHMQLKVYVLSQRWMNVSLSFRTMASEVYYCMNYAKKPIFGYLRLARFMNIFRYVHFNKEDIEDGTGLPRMGAKPIWAEMIWPEMGPAHEYQLYRSYSHAGTLEEQEAEIKAVTNAMLGKKDEPRKTNNTQEDDMPKKDHYGLKIQRWALRLAIIIGMFFLGRISVGSTEGPQPEQQTTQQNAEAAETPATDAPQHQTPETAANQQQPEEQGPPVWAEHRITGITQNGVMIHAESILLGETHHDLLLVAVDETAGNSIWIGEDASVYHWPAGGRARPGVLPDVVRERLAQTRRNAAALQQPSITPEAADGLDNP